jgi:hypothetical protein
MTNTSNLDRYNESIFSFYENSLMNVSNAFAQASLSSIQFSIKLSNAFTEAYPIYLNTLYEYNRSWKDLSELDKILRSRTRRPDDRKRCSQRTLAQSRELVKKRS